MSIRNILIKKRMQELLGERADHINRNLPLSEKWFQHKWRMFGLELKSDQYNTVFFKFIPDVTNHVFKYVIEVDGSIHDNKKQKKIDRRKDRCYRNHGYRVFRIRPYNDYEFLLLALAVLGHRRVHINHQRYLLENALHIRQEQDRLSKDYSPKKFLKYRTSW